MIDVTMRYEIRQTSKLVPFSVILALADFLVHSFTIYDEDFDSRDPPGVWELFYDGVSTKLVVATVNLELALELVGGETLIVCSYLDRVEFILLDEHRRPVQPSVLSLASGSNESLFEFSASVGDESYVIARNRVDMWKVMIRGGRIRRFVSAIPGIRWLALLVRNRFGSLLVDKR